MKNESSFYPVVQQSIYVDNYFFLHTTSNFLQDLTNRLLTLERFVRDIQHIRYIWIKPLKNSIYYEMLLGDAILLCSINDKIIEVNGIYDKNIRNHAQFIKEGVALGFKKEVIVIHQNTIQNKQVEKNCRSEEAKMSELIRSIAQKFSYTVDNEAEQKTGINHKSYEIEFENWLNLYDQSTLQLLESYIVGQPQIKYKKIASDHMFGEFTILFYIDSVLPYPFTYGHSFYVKLLTNEWINGSFAERFVDDNMNVIVLKFERILEVHELENKGNLYLLFEKLQTPNKLYQIYYSQLHPTNVLRTLFADQIVVERSSELISLPLHIQSEFKLSDEQQTIAKRAIESKQIFYIDGVVSTGKSKLLKCIRSYYEHNDERVLYITSTDLHYHADEDIVRTLPQQLILLKEETLNAINEFERKIVSDKKIITSYASDALDLSLVEREYKNLSQYLKGFYDDFNTNYFEVLTKLYSEYLQNEKTINELYVQIEKEEKKLLQKLGKGEFAKWLILPVVVGQQSSFKKKYAKYMELISRQKEVVSIYNDTSKKVESILNDEQLKHKKETWELQRKHIDHLNHKLAEPIQLFSDVLYYGEQSKDVYNKEDILNITNQLERLHQSIKDYKQMITNDADHLFFSIFIKDKKSLQLSMKMLHTHFSLFINQFDTILIDDAHTYTVFELFLAISLGKKVIIAGDQHQSSLVATNKNYIDNIIHTTPQLYQRSAAQVLAHLLPETAIGKLQFLYRVMPNLTTIYNQVIFPEDSNNKNKTDVKMIKTINNITNPVLVLTTSQTRNRHESEIPGYGIYNHCEANAIIDLVVTMLTATSKSNQNNQTPSETIRNPLTPRDILITSFFDMQIEYIRTHLRYALPNFDKETIEGMVQPLSSCVGIESKIVFVSLCTSNKMADSIRNLSHLRHAHLWNIALSRAKHQLILIGDVDYIKNSTSLERRFEKPGQHEFTWSSFDVANVMKLFLKIAMSGELQFVSLENFSKQLNKVTGGFGYE